MPFLRLFKSKQERAKLASVGFDHITSRISGIALGIASLHNMSKRWDRRKKTLTGRRSHKICD